MIFTGPASGLRGHDVIWGQPIGGRHERPDPAVAGGKAGQPGAPRPGPPVPAAGPRPPRDRGRDLRAEDRGGGGAVPDRGPVARRRDRRPADLAGTRQRHALVLDPPRVARLGSLGRGGAERAYAGARRAARGGNYARSAYTTGSEPIPDL